MVGPDNKIVVVSQHGTLWSLVKGTLEMGESKIAALKREVEEETGLKKFQVVRELGTYDRYMIGVDGEENRSELKTITFFLCVTEQKGLNPQDSENPEARWVEPSKVGQLLTHPKDKEFYLKALPKIKRFINLRES